MVYLCILFEISTPNQLHVSSGQEVSWTHPYCHNVKGHCELECLNDILCRFQQYFSHITVTAHIIHVLTGFHQYWVGALKCLAKGHSHKKPRGSSAT